MGLIVQLTAPSNARMPRILRWVVAGNPAVAVTGCKCGMSSLPRGSWWPKPLITIWPSMDMRSTLITGRSRQEMSVGQPSATSVLQKSGACRPRRNQATWPLAGRPAINLLRKIKGKPELKAASLQVAATSAWGVNQSSLGSRSSSNGGSYYRAWTLSESQGIFSDSCRLFLPKL